VSSEFVFQHLDVLLAASRLLRQFGLIHAVEEELVLDGKVRVVVVDQVEKTSIKSARTSRSKGASAAGIELCIPTVRGSSAKPIGT